MKDFEVINHGVMFSDYFQGCGTAFTNWEYAVTGVGGSEAEALDDALDMLAQSSEHDIDTVDLEARIKETYGEPSTKSIYDDSEDDDVEMPYLHLSIRYKL